MTVKEMQTIATIDSCCTPKDTPTCSSWDDFYEFWREWGREVITDSEKDDYGEQ